MKKLLLTLALLLGIGGTSFANSYPNAISPQDTKALLEQGKAVLIDIREQSEIAQGMAEPALWYPKSSIDANFDGFISYLAQFAGKEIVLYCRSGNRVSQVIPRLAEKGVNAWNMGGYKDWLAAGFGSKNP